MSRAPTGRHNKGRRTPTDVAPPGLANFTLGPFQGLASLATRPGPSGAKCTCNFRCSAKAKVRVGRISRRALAPVLPRSLGYREVTLVDMARGFTTNYKVSIAETCDADSKISPYLYNLLQLLLDGV